MIYAEIGPANGIEAEIKQYRDLDEQMLGGDLSAIQCKKCVEYFFEPAVSFEGKFKAIGEHERLSCAVFIINPVGRDHAVEISIVRKAYAVSDEQRTAQYCDNG